MTEFHTCHNCKFLYHDSMLIQCKFTSDKLAIPKTNQDTSCDPQLSEINVV